MFESLLNVDKLAFLFEEEKRIQLAVALMETVQDRWTRLMVFNVNSLKSHETWLDQICFRYIRNY